MLFGYSDYLMESFLSLFDNLEFVVRILLSSVLGALIGLERSRRRKEAGIRTHIIIAVTSAVFMILSKYAFQDVSDVVSGRGADPSRIASQVVSGISFLCAGVIFRQGKYSIRGLTTAAGMWATAAVGMAIGSGMYCVGICEALILVIMQIILHKHPVGNDAMCIQDVRLRVSQEADVQDVLKRLEQVHKGNIAHVEMSKENGSVLVKATLMAPEPLVYSEAIKILTGDERIRELTV